MAPPEYRIASRDMSWHAGSRRTGIMFGLRALYSLSQAAAFWLDNYNDSHDDNNDDDTNKREI